MNQKGRRVESCLQNKIRTLGTIGNVLRAHKLTKHFPGDDERHLQESD
jgi:hypothetical protein